MKRTMMVIAVLCAAAWGCGVVWAESAYIDFSSYPSGEPYGSGMRLIGACGVDNNPYYEHSVRLLSNGSYVEFVFDLPGGARDVTLTLDHLASASQDAYNGGWSPVNICLNGSVIAGDFSPKSHGIVQNTWDVSGWAVSGRNELRIQAADIQTHYWLQRAAVAWNWTYEAPVEYVYGGVPVPVVVEHHGGESHGPEHGHGPQQGHGPEHGGHGHEYGHEPEHGYGGGDGYGNGGQHGGGHGHGGRR